MPQLMPLFWMSSSFMSLLLLFVFINMYFTNILNELSFMSNKVLNKNYMMEW